MSLPLVPDRTHARLPRGKVHPLANVRTECDPKGLDELVESLRNIKQQVPVIVYPHPDRPGEYALADGYRRWLALARVPCDEIEAVILSQVPKPAQLRAIQLSLGVTNERLNAYDLAEGARELIRELGLTQDAVAEMIGISPANLSKAMTISAHLISELRADVEAGLIPFGHAACIARLKGNVDGQRAIAERVKKFKLKRQVVEREVDKLLGSKKTRRQQPVKAGYDGASLVLPGTATWEAVQAFARRLAEAAKTGASRELPLQSLPSLLKPSAN